MDKDRIDGSAKEAKGAVKEVAGKITSDAHLRNEGKADKAEGKVQNAIGRGRYPARGRYGGAGLGSTLGWVVVVLVLLSVFGALDGFAPRGMDRDRIGNA